MGAHPLAVSGGQGILDRLWSALAGDKMLSMPHGPRLSGVLEQALWNEPPWSDYITERTHHVLSIEHTDPDKGGELSEHDIHVLTRVSNEYGHLDRNPLRQLTCALPEYKDPNGP